MTVVKLKHIATIENNRPAHRISRIKFTLCEILCGLCFYVVKIQDSMNKKIPVAGDVFVGMVMTSSVFIYVEITVVLFYGKVFTVFQEVIVFANQFSRLFFSVHG